MFLSLSSFTPHATLQKGVAIIAYQLQYCSHRPRCGSRGVHQIAYTAKIAPKLLAQWHNYIAPQHCTTSNGTSHRMMQCCLQFYNKKIAQTAPHPLYKLIYLFIFNIKYIINSLITLVFQKKKSLITLASVD